MFIHRVKLNSSFDQTNVRFQRPQERDEWQRTFPWPLPKGYTISYHYNPDGSELVIACVPIEEAKDNRGAGVDAGGQPLPSEWEAERQRLLKFNISELRVMARELNLNPTNKQTEAVLVDMIVTARKNKLDKEARDAKKEAE
jgi:hypothetical protein